MDSDHDDMKKESSTYLVYTSTSTPEYMKALQSQDSVLRIVKLKRNTLPW